jgi:hypothetical protein
MTRRSSAIAPHDRNASCEGSAQRARQFELLAPPPCCASATPIAFQRRTRISCGLFESHDRSDEYSATRSAAMTRAYRRRIDRM